MRARHLVDPARAGQEEAWVSHPIPSFEILETAAGPAIRCRACGMTSYHPQDVQHGYCGFCHAFHRGVTQSVFMEAVPIPPA